VTHLLGAGMSRDHVKWIRGDAIGIDRYLLPHRCRGCQEELSGLYAPVWYIRIGILDSVDSRGVRL
jgi:hypothetical protein